MRLVHRRKVVPGVIDLIIEALDVIIIIVAVIVIQATVGGIAVSMADFLKHTITDMMITLPDFDYGLAGNSDYGNETFNVYEQLRWASLVILLFVIVICATGRLLNQGSKQDRFTDMLKQAAFAIIIILIFPAAWDMMAGLMHDGSAWVLNPLYSFDPENPCPAGWSDEQIIEHYNDSGFNRNEQAWWFDTQRAQDACRPEFRMSYLIDQMALGQNYEIPDQDPFEWIFHQMSLFATGTVTHVFFGMIKSIVTIQVVFIATMTAILADMLTAMIIAGLPILLVIRMFPMCKGIVDKLFTSLPALYLIPLMSAIIILVGSGFVGSFASSDLAGESIAGLDMGVIYIWIGSLGVVFFAVALPTVLVPLLGNITQQASSIVTSAVQSATVVTAGATIGAAKGLSGGRRGVMRGLVSGGVGAAGK